VAESNDDISDKSSKKPASNPDTSGRAPYEPKPDEKWLMQEEVAEKLHIALDTMRRYVREGKFPHAKVGKRYFIPEGAIEDFLQRGLITGPREVKHRAKPQGEHTEREQQRETQKALKGQRSKRRGEE
jgi:excisionase family DNA binding protein